MPAPIETDVLVCGGGMSGLTAAVSARQAGASVLLIEKGPDIGGSAMLSGGTIWTFAEFEKLRENAPNGDPELQRLVIETIDEGRAWLESIGVQLEPEKVVARYGRGRVMDPALGPRTMFKRFCDDGGAVRCKTGVESLVFEDGRLTGAIAATEDGPLEIKGRAVVLATGGFHGNADLVAKYISRSASNLYIRGNPWTTGDGLLAAVKAGAATTSGLDCIYGHAMPARPARFGSMKFRAMSQYYGQMALAINMAGVRFADESIGNGEEHLNARLAQQPDGCGFYIIDAETAAREVGDDPAGDMVERARLAGAPYVASSSLQELCSGLANFGVSAETVATTIADFNEALANGKGRLLDPPRCRFEFPLKQPPFYAVGVKASVTFTMGGLAVDTRTRVLRRAASISSLAQESTFSEQRRDVPIQGLFAAGCDIGNINHDGYVGGLGPALCTGRIAGAEAARAAREST